MPQVHDQEFPDYDFACVTIDDADLNAEFVRVPADLAYWARRAADAEEAYLAAKHNLKRAEAGAWLRTRERLDQEEQMRADAEERKPKFAAVAVVDRAAEADQELNMARGTLQTALRSREECRGMVSAIHTKREMLVSLGANLRKEMERDPLIRDPDDDDAGWND